MNERFIEHAKNAGFDVERLMAPYPGGFPREDMLALESFAESIIRQCVALCAKIEDDGELSDYPGGFRDGALLCQQEIKEHFGVK